MCYGMYDAYIIDSHLNAMWALLDAILVTSRLTKLSDRS